MSLLSSLNVAISTGPDGLPNTFLRRYAERVANYFTCIFSKSLRESEIPDDWFIAKVVPVRKGLKRD